ncbi:MAG: ATP-binding protein [Spirochaetales bacterium]|nr:ATP-binding protein [Spirochaetales bacterium]
MKANAKMVTKLMFRLLPVQVLLAAVGSVNGIVSTFFATNYVGIDAMGAVGLYNPLNLLIGAISIMLVGGSTILCGTYSGKNQLDSLQNAFSLDLVLSFLISAAFVVLYVISSMFDLTGIFTKDPAVRPLFNGYLLGQAVGVIPLLLGNQLASFLALENKGKLTVTASLVFIVLNVILNYIFVNVMRLEAFGLAIASSLGLWVFFAIQAQYFVFGKSHLRFRIGKLDWKDSRKIFRIGIPGAASQGYQTVRSFILNWLMATFVGSVGISAFAASGNLLNIFWALPVGMLAVSRLLMSVSIGEEDRQTLTNVMRVMFRRYLPLMGVVCVAIIACSVPITNILFHDPYEPVYRMALMGIRLMPLCMPLSIILMHFVCYGQIQNRQLFVHVLSVLDGIACVIASSVLTIKAFGMTGVYLAMTINGIITTIVIIGYAWGKKKHFPRNMDELMVIPDDFGASEDERMDLSIRSIEDVVSISQQVQAFCREKGIDERRSYLAGLSMEEMAGNIVDHGFTKDRKKHSVDVRVVHKDGGVILRIKDDCVPFNPSERMQMANGDDVLKNIGIRMVFGIASDVKYQNILGLNVLTIRI